MKSDGKAKDNIIAIVNLKKRLFTTQHNVETYVFSRVSSLSDHELNYK